jgi:hypothetical protein
LCLSLAGCASGPPTIELDAAAFTKAYVAERDAFRDRTAPARRKCLVTTGVASDTLKAKCDALREAEAIWAARDAAVLQAILTRSTIDAETLAAVGRVAERVLTLAADILL